jgi:hypothetical protein
MLSGLLCFKAGSNDPVSMMNRRPVHGSEKRAG